MARGIKYYHQDIGLWVVDNRDIFSYFNRLKRQPIEISQQLASEVQDDVFPWNGDRLALVCDLEIAIIKHQKNRG